MLQLTVTAKASDVVLQDPFPADGMWALTVLAGTSKSVVISWDQFQRIATQVKDLEDAGFCTVTMEIISNGEVRGQENDLIGTPAIDYVLTGAAGFTIPLIGAADVEIHGDQLIAQQEIAHVVLGDPLTPNACIDFISPTPGIQGNDLEVEIVDTGVVPGALSVTVLVSKVTIDLDGTTPDAGAVATAVNTALTGARGTVFAVAGGTGLGTVLVAALTSLSGGSGAGMSVTLGGQPCVVIQSVPGALPTDPQTIYVDTPDLTGIIATATSVNLHLRSGNKKTTSSHTLA